MKKFITSQFLLLLLSTGNFAYATSEILEVDLFIKNHIFSPEILELPAGQKIRITVHNQDDSIEEFETTDLKREKIIAGKSKAVVIFAPLKPGEYEFFGEFHPETAKGKIIVTENGATEECSK
jgi:plastocyanin